MIKITFYVSQTGLNIDLELDWCEHMSSKYKLYESDTCNSLRGRRRTIL